MTDRYYWASEPDPDKLAALLKERIDRFRQAADTSGRRQLWAIATRMLYGLDPAGGYRKSHYLIQEGAQGEDFGSRLNIFRSFVKSQLVIVTGSRPSFSCRPIAYDADVEEIVVIGDAWLDKCLDDGLEVDAVASALKALFLGEGWLCTTWNDVGGDLLGSTIEQSEDGQEVDRPLCSGAIRVLSLRPDEVVRDPDVRGGPSAHRWLCASVQRDRWELMAQYPEYAEEIRNAPSYQDQWIFGTLGTLQGQQQDMNGDMVTTYELYHRKTLSMPEGLFALLVGDCIVSRSALPYDDLPFDVMISDRDPGASFGYGESWDTMAAQQVIDSIWMQMSTNRENFGRPNLFMFSGTNIDPYDVGGTRLITGTQPPQVIDLSTGGIESGKIMLDIATEGMQQMTGLNDASIGQGSSTASGTALAQQEQTAVRFNGSLQLAYVFMLQGSMRKHLKIAQKFVTDEQLIHVAGKNRAAVVKRFKGDDFKQLEGVSIELGSAAMRTSGSRHVIANELLSSGVITDPQTYLDMIATGRTEPALEGPRILETQAERLIVEVQEGRGYKIQPTMPHALMIQRLGLLLADPSMSAESPVDPATGQPILDPATGQPMQSKGDMARDLVMQHGDMWTQMSMNPGGMAVLMATGQTPAPGAQMLMAPPPGAPPNPGDAPPGEPTANPDVKAPQNAPQPSPSGQQSPEASQPTLSPGATPVA